MPKVRMTPTLAPDSGVRDQYDGQAETVKPVDLGKPVAALATQGMKLSAELENIEYKNSFAQHKNELDEVKRETFAQMQLQPGAEEREKVMRDGEKRHRKLVDNYKFKDFEDVRTFTNHDYNVFSITGKANSSALFVKEQKSNFMNNVETNSNNFNIPIEARRENLDLYLKENVGKTMSEAEAKEYRVNQMKLIEVNDFTNNTNSSFSIKSLDNAYKTLSVENSDDLTFAENATRNETTELKKAISANTILEEDEKNSLLQALEEQSISGQKKLTSRYVGGQSELLTEFKTNIEMAFTDGDDDDLTRMSKLREDINSISDPLTRDAAQNYFDAKTKEVSVIATRRNALEDQNIADYVKTNQYFIASGTKTKAKVLFDITEKLYETDEKGMPVKDSNGNLVPNKKISQNQFTSLSAAYTTISRASDPVLVLAEEEMKKVSAISPLLKNPTLKELKSLKNSEGKKYSDLDTEEERIQFAQEQADIINTRKIKLTKQTINAIREFHGKNLRLPTELEMVDLNETAYKKYKAVEFKDGRVTRKRADRRGKPDIKYSLTLPDGRPTFAL